MQSSDEQTAQFSTPVLSGDSVATVAAIETDERFVALQDATIMIVDDEPTTICMLEVFLDDAGFRNFVTTDDSRLAIEMLDSQRPDVLLLDLNMPHVSGLDILEEIRVSEGLNQIPVVILTAAADADTKLRALELGATDFLAKPVDPSELALRLRNTLAAKMYRDRLEYFDSLTTLPNRLLFLQRLERALERSRNAGDCCAMMHLDLDRFKQINDTLGHTYGDALLARIAERLWQVVRADDYVERFIKYDRSNLSRFGGDEFALLLPGLASAEQASLVARRLLESFKEPFQIGRHELYVTPSIGIAVFPDDGESLEPLLQNAAVATSHAKNKGRNNYKFYSTELNARHTHRLKLETSLRKVLERDELELHIQPKVDIALGRIVGGEALIRWNSEEHGMIAPFDFIPIAEETGLIVPIGDWVISQACAIAQEWRTAGFNDLSIAINLSAVQFRQGSVLHSTQQALETSGLPGEQVTLELTESLLMQDPDKICDTLEDLKQHGVRLSIDDFGTGYSSLSYLKRFPLDELKIDRSFLFGVPADTDNSAIVAAILAMSHSLGLKVVAEGVETAEQLRFLRSLGCEEYQGYFFSKPVPAPEFLKLLTT